MDRESDPSPDCLCHMSWYPATDIQSYTYYKKNIYFYTLNNKNAINLVKRFELLIVDTFSNSEPSSVSFMGSDHVSGYCYILHSMVTSYPIVHTQTAKEW